MHPDQWEGPHDVQLQQADRERRPMSDHIVWFEDYLEDRDRERVGGKNASLGTMVAAGLPVPPGYGITTEAYARLRNDHGVHDRVHELLDGLDITDAAAAEKVSVEVRRLMESLTMDDDVAAAIVGAYDELSARCGVEDVPVAVRSSATAEDQPDASFAGQQDTYLWVRGGDAVLEHVKRCWSSLYTARAMQYRQRMGYGEQQVSMGVVVQKMVDPVAAGVAFTLNPQNGDRTQVAIDASWGLGESVVSGEVTPDNFTVDKVLRQVVGRIISAKHIEYRLVDDHVEKVEVEAERQQQQCLSDDEICAVAAMARRAEDHYGRPQDIEWAVDKHLPAGENVVLLQARPETVWSNKPVTPISSGYDAMSSIVSTLTKPLAARQKQTN